jgi:hypothetical protein
MAGSRRKLRSALAASVAIGLVVSAAGPARAADTDVTAPVMMNTGITAGQLIPRNFKFIPIATDDVGVARFHAQVGDAVNSVYCGPTSCTVYIVQLPEGAETTLSVWATDAAGNKSDVVTTPIRADFVGPSAKTSPVLRSSVPVGPVAITLSAVPADVVKAEMIAGREGAVLATRAEGPWEFTWNAVDGAPVPQFRLTDQAGNVVVWSSQYVVDSDAPIIESVDYVGSFTRHRVDRGGWTGAFTNLVHTVRDESKIVRTEWRLNGQVVSTDAMLHWVSGNHPGPTAVLAVQVWDEMGFTSSKSFTLNIDLTAPTMTVYPAERALIRGATFRTWINASDPHGIAYNTVGARDGSAGMANAFTLKSGRDGVRSFTWTSVDKFGNNDSVTRTVIIDNTAPVVGYRKAPKNNAKLKGKVWLSATAGDRNGIARVQLLVNGKVVATDARAGYNLLLNPKKYGKRFTVQLRAYDRAGNVKYSTKRVYRR